MGINWMTLGELSQAVPPAYTRFIGGQLLAAARGLSLAAA
jgi:DNA (cytosine-5)-methyltransferase 1